MGIDHFFAPENANEAPEVLDLALKLAIERGGQTTPVSDYDIGIARERITGEVCEVTKLRAEIAGLRKAARYIMPYLDWTIGPESPGCHPTMPSAVGAFKEAFRP